MKQVYIVIMYLHDSYLTEDDDVESCISGVFATHRDAEKKRDELEELDKSGVWLFKVSKYKVN